MGQEEQVITKHIILYALNRYQRNGCVVDDVETIISALLGIPKEFLTLEDIFRIVVGTFSDLAHNEPEEKVKFYEGVFDDWQKYEITDEEMLEYFFDFIASVDLEKIDLGEPDATVLPIQKYFYT